MNIKKNIIALILYIGIPLSIILYTLIFLRIPMNINDKSDILEIETILQRQYNKDSVNITYIGPLYKKGPHYYQLVKYTFPNAVLDSKPEHSALIKLKEINLKYHVDSIIQKTQKETK